MSMLLSHGAIRSAGQTLLAGVSDEIHAESETSGSEVFLVARARASSSRLVFALGAMPTLERFTACHRYEPYWMRPAAGTRLSQVPPETQFVLGQLRSKDWVIAVPLIGELFRFSLRGRKDDSLELLAETGDAFAPGEGGLALYLATGPDPFALVREGARSVHARLQTGRLRRDKAVPDFADLFGWCTWDAFYDEVSADKVRQGLERFAQGGVRPRMLILDDGWQTTAPRPTGEKRLTSFSANEKFPGGLGPTVRMAKEEFGVSRFLVWQSIVGYWGGVDGDRLVGYGVIDQTRQFGEGVLAHEPSFNQIWWGNVVGFVPSANIRSFFDDYHRSLRAHGVDGVKVDSQAVLESVAQRQGGRIAVTRAYREALEASVDEHFGGRLINCMSNGQETWYGSGSSTILRSSIDFFPSRPETHGSHLYANAQVGLWFGEFMLPDWDMFQSAHEWGAYHAAGRAISGGPVYVSDAPGRHDFALLAKLVCSDGTVLRCDGPGLPTLDSLCVDPTRDDAPLKIWNRNGAAGVVGVFNARRPGDASAAPFVHGIVRPADVPGFGAARYACYAHQARSLEVLAPGASRTVTLAPREFELFTMVPIERGFAAMGLTNKLNGSGAIVRFSWTDERTCEITLRDGGEFLAWSESAPVAVAVDGKETTFAYEATTGALRFQAPGAGRCVLQIRYFGSP